MDKHENRDKQAGFGFIKVQKIQWFHVREEDTETDFRRTSKNSHPKEFSR
ncbi:MAG: hypothetical protein RDU01_03000 [Thermodesulfovibrionales bacterium]|nr:hypothetical protein [Thermodesulfovibrionales bacterium]